MDIAPGDIGDMVITCKDSAGANVVTTLKTMKCIGHSENMNRASPPGSYDWAFTYQGAGAGLLT
jgi:hypothetical protein